VPSLPPNWGCSRLGKCAAGVPLYPNRVVYSLGSVFPLSTPQAKTDEGFRVAARRWDLSLFVISVSPYARLLPFSEKFGQKNCVMLRTASILYQPLRELFTGQFRCSFPGLPDGFAKRKEIRPKSGEFFTVVFYGRTFF